MTKMKCGLRQMARVEPETTVHNSAEQSDSISEEPEIDQYQITQPQTISFHELPPEVRNMVYKLVFESRRVEHIPKIRFDKEGPVEDRATKQKRSQIPVLLQLSKQIRSEYKPTLLYSVPVHYPVINFDFRDLLRFLRRLSTPELEVLRSSAVFKILLVIDEFKRPQMDRLYDWLRFQTSPAWKSKGWPYMRYSQTSRGWIHRETWASKHFIDEMDRLQELMVKKSMKVVLADFINYNNKKPESPVQSNPVD